jgi:6-phosphogluconolactonase/glucosamine-6-phosphate isomerase/deaminase
MVLSAGRRLTFVVTGENKSNILKDVYLEQGLGVQAPAARVALAAQNVEWYVDEKAAAGLAG